MNRNQTTQEADAELKAAGKLAADLAYRLGVSPKEIMERVYMRQDDNGGKSSLETLRELQRDTDDAADVEYDVAYANRSQADEMANVADCARKA